MNDKVTKQLLDTIDYVGCGKIFVSYIILLIVDTLVLKNIREYRIMEEKLNKILDYIKDFVKRNNFSPTIKQIAEDLKYDVETEVKPAIEELVAKGKI